MIADHEGVFSKLVREFGGGEAAKEEVKEEVEVDAIELNGDERKVPEVKRAAALMQEEERATGAVSASSELPSTMYTRETELTYFDCIY